MLVPETLAALIVPFGLGTGCLMLGLLVLEWMDRTHARQRLRSRH
jgi:hypothetical protein